MDSYRTIFENNRQWVEKKILLLFTLFSLSLTAQVKENQGGGIRDLGKISHKGQPLCIVDGKKYTKLRDKFKKLQPEDIAHIMVFYPERAKGLFGSRAKNGVLYIITKETFQKAEALANNPPNRQFNRKERHYAEIWEIYQMQQPIVVSGKVTDKEGNPLANIRVYNKDRNTESYTDSLGNYTIKAERWDMLMVHCCTSCKLITDEEKTQEINFVGSFEGTYKEAEKAYIEEMIKRIPPSAIVQISEDHCATPLFVLDGMVMDKKEFREKTSRLKISKEIHYLTPAAATAICGSGAIDGVLVVVTEKAKRKYEKRQARKAQKNNKL
ncbi:carboxypeptidase regulatory-like domain-containing protein [Capnocytophaga sp. G2]|uniref:carboxypeptidase-like regulatory domain-containing protein n=1 Tax=Capnocytophaga sp. G2 TaxID=3110695 RepID=UPI002B4A3B53|nr:carboxypeptidase regulatory-like domain-containing protein [Capnocytophaga sp. G2]MEB3003928.1 carboxypeptidase regulatory-like domain-containing protein [Capnocytophaga sp. G2]